MLVGKIEMMICVSNEEIFKNYVNKFDINDENILRKYNHSLSVMQNAKEIAISLKLSPNKISLISFIALVHDIGRFKQWEIYKSFKLKNFDHAKYGIDILYNEKIINVFNIDRKFDSVIKSAIFNHNKEKITNCKNDFEILVSKIIRDADKLDLLRLLSEKKIVIDEDGSLVTDVISNKFFNCELINYNERKNMSDKILSKFAFVFDLNFKKSFEILVKNKYIEKFYNNLEYKNVYFKYFEFLMNFIKNKKDTN